MNTFQESMYRYLSRDEKKTCVIGHSFIRRIIRRWMSEEIALPDFAFDAFGTGGMTLATLLNIVSSMDFSTYHSVYIQAGENDLMSQSVNDSKRLMVQIYDELKSQGVREVKFGQMFPRHNRQFNKRASLLNRMMVKQHPEKIWLHDDTLVSVESISRRDHTHLLPSREAQFSCSISKAVESNYLESFWWHSKYTLN